MDSFTDGTASLWQYDDRKRQLDLFCVTGVHSSIFTGKWTYRNIIDVECVRQLSSDDDDDKQRHQRSVDQRHQRIHHIRFIFPPIILRLWRSRQSTSRNCLSLSHPTSSGTLRCFVCVSGRSISVLIRRFRITLLRAARTWWVMRKIPAARLSVGFGAWQRRGEIHSGSRQWRGRLLWIITLDEQLMNKWTTLSFYEICLCDVIAKHELQQNTVA